MKLFSSHISNADCQKEGQKFHLSQFSKALTKGHDVWVLALLLMPLLHAEQKKSSVNQYSGTSAASTKQDHFFSPTVLSVIVF